MQTVESADIPPFRRITEEKNEESPFEIQGPSSSARRRRGLSSDIKPSPFALQNADNIFENEEMHFRALNLDDPKVQSKKLEEKQPYEEPAMVKVYDESLFDPVGEPVFLKMLEYKDSIRP